MSAHRYHPDPVHGDPKDALLFDNCPRCEAHAQHLTGLDDETLTKLVLLSLGDTAGQTKTEQAAADRIYRTIVLAQRLGRLQDDPAGLNRHP
jgi:hypothetical protein